jgi:hypothetical protein
MLLLSAATRVLDVLSGWISVKASVERVTVGGRLRVVLRPLLGTAPLLGGVALSFVETPKFR